MLMVKENDRLTLERRRVLRRKMMAIGKISRVYRALKKNPELVTQLKTISVNGKIPMGILIQGEQGMKQVITTYNTTRPTKTPKE
ncbi:hypothetical protein BY458DRAFT_498208 [Sporodiniella umbellata]|nr:hypothetical protein BY458DRAFT_498208 [Sporodiniella umbellata]